MTLFAYPQKAAFGRVLPKTKIYQYAGPSTAMKKLFVDQVDQVAWAYKLAPETINVKATKTVPEIQVFTIALKTGELKEDVLRCIDKAIPFPILFELAYDGKVKAVACYKRPSEADSTKWVLSVYFETPWLAADAPRAALPLMLDLAALYAELLRAIIPHPAKQGESLQDHIARVDAIRARQKEVTKAEARMTREKQFNRKVEINANIRTIEQEIADLTGKT
ncbi:MAG: DUF4391 domain-containing protein [Alphaproteobacteria bacterium]|nr:DUF4391 domain-containing protein [Alphaproteobacteria bacterium]